MTRSASAAERACFGDDVRIECPANVAMLGEVVRAAEAQGGSVVPAGSGAHPEAGDPPAREPVLVSAERFAGVVVYEPDDFTIGVGAGMRLAELRAELARHRQEIAHPLPHAPIGTIGGLIARAPYSLRHGAAGPLHSLVLGVEGVRGGGRPFRAGGMVVKNVAGYQIHKLCVGAAGTLGVLTRINLRLRPLPERRAVSLARFSEPAAAVSFARELRARRLEPAFLVVLFGGAAGILPDGSVGVVWSFEGSSDRVTWLEQQGAQVASAAGVALETRGDAEAVPWFDALASIEEPPADRAAGVVRLAVVPAVAPDLGAELTAERRVPLRVLADVSSGAVVVRWNDGAASPEAILLRLAESARRHRGVATLVHLPAAVRHRYPRDLAADPNASLAARVRAAFDPQGAFARAPSGAMLVSSEASR
jgi:glycolate oxidase FAD binding subunit